MAAFDASKYKLHLAMLVGFEKNLLSLTLDQVSIAKLTLVAPISTGSVTLIGEEIGGGEWERR